MACYRFIQSSLTLIVDFDGDNSGVSIVDEMLPRRFGKYYEDWITYKDTTCWEPCADPRLSQRVNKMLKHIKDS